MKLETIYTAVTYTLDDYEQQILHDVLISSREQHKIKDYLLTYIEERDQICQDTEYKGYSLLNTDDDIVGTYEYIDYGLTYYVDVYKSVLL